MVSSNYEYLLETGNMYGSASTLPACTVPGYWNNLQTMETQITSTVQNENGQREVPRNIRKYGTEQIAHTKSFFEESKKLNHSETSMTKITEALNENSFKGKFHYQKQDLTIENDEFVNDWPSADHMFSGYSVELDVHNVNDYSNHTSLNAVNRHSHQYSFGLSNVPDGTYGNNPWNSSFFSNWTCNNYLTGHTFTEPEGEHKEQQGVRDLEEHDWRVRTCVGCQRTKQQEQQQQERTSQAAPGRARRAPAPSSSSSSSQRPRAASAPRPRTPRAPALRSVVSRPGAAPRSAAQRPAARAGPARPATPRAPAWRPTAWRPATPHAAGVARLSSLRPIALRPPKFSSRPRTAQPAARLAARSAPRHAHLHAPRAAHPTPRFQTRHSTRSSSDDFPTDPRLRSPWYKRRLPYNLLNFLICEELRTLRAMKRARAATDNQARSRPGRSPQQRQERAVAAAGDAQEARDPRRRNDRDVRLRAMERARAARLGASDPRRARGRGAAAASPPRPFRRPFTDEPVPTAAAAAGGERTPPRTVPIADEELHDSAPTAVINGVVWRTNKLGDDAVEPGIGVCYRFWSTWVRVAQEEGGAMRAQSFRVREFNLAEARLARHEVTKARRLLRLPPRRLPLEPLSSPSPRRPPTAPPRLEAPADAHCCECCRCCTCRNCCACDEVGDCCDRCESCRQVMEKHSRPRSPPPPPPPPPAQPPPPPLPAGTRKATPPPPPTSPVKQSVPIVPLLLLSMMVPKKEKSPDPSVSPHAVSPFPLSVWPTLLHSPPAVVPPPQSPVSIPDSISSSLHSQNALDRNQIVPVCPSEVDAQDTFASMPPLPADVFTGEDSSSSSVIIISPPPPGVPRPTTMPQSNEQLRAFPVPAPWPTSLELPFIPLPSGESCVLKKVESVSSQPQRTFASVGYFPENVADIPLPDAPPPPLCNGLSIPLPPRSLLSAPGSSLNNPAESYHSDEGEFLTSSNLVVDMDLDEDSAEEPMIEITENVQNMM